MTGELMGRPAPWNRSSFRLHPSSFLAAALLLPVVAQAQDAYPSRPVRVLVGLAPGGATDIQTRLFAQKLTEAFNRPFVVENRPGAGGTVAYAQLAKAPADGHTLMGITGGFTITPHIYRKLPYDPAKDFTPIALVVRAPFVLAVHPSLPAKSVRDLLALAKAQPGALNCASAGLGSSTHMAFELFKALAGVKITHVPYKGTGPALVDAMAGQVHMLFGNVLSMFTHVKSGRLRALAVTTDRRSKVLPELPTIAESGVPAYENSTWHGWLAPAGVPPAIVNRLNAELVKAAQAPDLAEKLAADGGEGVSSTPEQFARLIATETARWGKVIKEAGITLEP
ncbi:MAG TPA: tripartite tricarboxylate transporter substrate binding protein [Burkholderiales bacterium]|nr:tripartite tricarboxylate transporter substrate binding protein [Burkholderiales bacterium]